MHEAATIVEWGWQSMHIMLKLSGLLQSAACSENDLLSLNGLVGQTLATALWHISIKYIDI